MSYLLQQHLVRSAERFPDRPAVEFGDGVLTYGELAVSAARIARCLHDRGVRPGDRVGLYLPKSLEAVAGLYGILGAGAAYVPLDPAAPAKRIAYIARNCGMRAIVSAARQLRGLLPESPGLESAVLVDAEIDAASLEGLDAVSWSELSAAPADPLPVPTIERDLAYILYTSGSTGEPKGVMISHRAALTFVNWAHDRFGITHEDRLSNHAPLHFDLSTFDIFAAVKAGATVLPVPESLSIFPRSLADFIEDKRISVWYSVPSALTRMLLHGELGRHGYERLRTVLFAGEVFPTKYLRGVMEVLSHVDFYNLYGPTETNVCTYHHVDALPEDDAVTIPIGRACANTEVFALTDDNQIAGVGQTGELYVRGPSLMSGYWGHAEKSAEVIVPHPLEQPLYGESVYRTGDLVQAREDGAYLFLGRRDNMIKSRGYRIELGEIETVLYTHPQVQEAAAIAIPDDEVGNLIQAVVVPSNGADLAEKDLQRFISDRLPKYMVPDRIEFERALPKTSTGKVDRPALVRRRTVTAATG